MYEQLLLAAQLFLAAIGLGFLRSATAGENAGLGVLGLCMFCAGAAGVLIFLKG